MTTIDNKVQNIKSEFDGDLARSHLDYERAVQGLEKAEERISVLEEGVKQATGFDNTDLPDGIVMTDLDIGDVHFTVRSETRTKRPQYKTAVERMEGYLTGVGLLIAQGNIVSNVIKDGRTVYIDIDTLLEAYSVIVAGIMKPEVKHTIKYETAGKVGSEGTLDEITLGKTDDLTPATAAEYVRLDRVTDDLAKFKKEYEAKLKKGKTTAVTQSKAYAKEAAEANGVDWAYVVMTLITVTTNPGKIGELNALAEMSEKCVEYKRKQFPHFKIIDTDLYTGEGNDMTYVSLNSIYNRIQQLKAEKTITSDRTQVNGKEII